MLCSLPDDLMSLVLSHLGPGDKTRVSSTCRDLFDKSAAWFGDDAFRIVSGEEKPPLEWLRRRDPVLDLAQLDLTTFPQWPAMGTAFATGYGDVARLGARVAERRELYAMYLLLAGIVYYRENDAPQRELAARDGLRRWLAAH